MADLSANPSKNSVIDVESSFIERKIESSASAIDKFYQRVAEVRLCAKTSSQVLRNYTLVACVSAVEAYFRELLSGIVFNCELSAQSCSEYPITYGSVRWHSVEVLERAAFDHQSFLAYKDVKSACAKMIGIDLSDKGEIASAFEEFEKISELRHCLVHASGIIVGKNAMRLSLTKGHTATVHVLENEILQVVDLATNVVRASNIEIFRLLKKRAAVEERKNAKFALENYFEKVLPVFYSLYDFKASLITKTMKEIIAEEIT